MDYIKTHQRLREWLAGHAYQSARIDRGVISLQFDADTPQAQQDAAEARLAAFDASPEATAAWEEDRVPERKAVRAAVADALTDLDAYLAAADAGTAAQIQQRDHAAVKRMARILKVLIPRVAQLD